MSRPIATVAVVGDGVVGLSAAAAFARALPQLAVTVVPADRGPGVLADQLPGTTSAIHGFHAAIGLDAGALMRRGAVLPRLALRFAGWGRGADPWWHVHAGHGRPFGSIAFHHYWSRAWREGVAAPWHAYSFAGAMARAGRFAFPRAEPGSPLASFDHGLRIDVPRYRSALSEHGARLGVRTAARLARVARRDDGGVAALVLADGAQLTCDLVIDAAGPDGPFGAADGFEDWGRHYPERHLSIADAAPLAPDPADTIAHAGDAWHWHAALADRSVRVSASRAPGAGGIRLRPGRMAEPWRANLLTIGDGAVALDPLHGLPLHAAQQAILRAIELLPDAACAPVETAEYNRRTRLETERLRDFQCLHHFVAGAADVPPSLAAVIGSFEARGRLRPADEDSLGDDLWLAALLGLGIVPRATTPLADTLSLEEIVAALAPIEQRAAGFAQTVPPFEARLAR